MTTTATKTDKVKENVAAAEAAANKDDLKNATIAELYAAWSGDGNQLAGARLNELAIQQIIPMLRKKSKANAYDKLRLAVIEYWVTQHFDKALWTKIAANTTSIESELRNFLRAQSAAPQGGRIKVFVDELIEDMQLFAMFADGRHNAKGGTSGATVLANGVLNVTGSKVVRSELAVAQINGSVINES